MPLLKNTSPSSVSDVRAKGAASQSRKMELVRI
jgi:hypothetical protein